MGLVSVSWLLRHHVDADVRVVDCRWVLGDPDAGARLYAAGHIPGAAFLDVDRDLSAPPSDAGRHPLPSAERFAGAAGSAGIGPGTLAVVHDEAGEGGAARAWWLLRHFGHERAGVLDRGLAGWRDAGGELAERGELIAPAEFESHERGDDTVGIDDLDGLDLYDARAPERFRGEVEPVDPMAGHVPGAHNLPHTSLVRDGRLLPREELLGALPGGDWVAYCGSGITAATLVLAAEVAGQPAPRLWPGGWSEWSRRA